MFTRNKLFRRRKAFTLVELLVAVLVSSILIGLTVSIYGLFRKSMALDQSRADITQNARIALDRMSREIRQTPDIVTEMPADPSDTSVSQPGEIEFEDGHAEDLTYRRYYVSGGVLHLDIKEYYFSYEPGVRVKWNSIGTGGVSPLSTVISTQDIATNVSSLLLYGGTVIDLSLSTSDTNGQVYLLRTSIYGRNI